MSDSRPDRWYLSCMAPNTKGDKFAWLDPSSLYINAKIFHALLDDLVKPFKSDDIDVVGGLDAMGFVLATGIATRLGKGMLPIRKAGKIPLNTDSVEFTNYSGRTQDMEIRKPAFAPGTRVLLVDQWVETSGTMGGAIKLVERQQGIVAGIAAVCIEENEKTLWLYEKYKCVSAVIPGSAIQDQCNRKTLNSFKNYKPELVFPAKR
ncbi:MAG: phosphoribosyltransferase family protein [Gammaproteobacteria bacterium]|nr:phosphoribosyltransferase family protein [Gammaproteobacteria bacterium]